MNTRNVIGQNIKSVQQRMVWNAQTLSMENVVESITLSNGYKLIPTVSEHVGAYATDFLVVKKVKKK